MIKCFLYLRVSGLGQVEGYGLDRQEEVCRAYAKQAGYEVAGIFREEGVSGCNDVEERPAFQEMMEALLANGLKTVIVESLDRLARELRIQESLIIYLASKGIELISARTGENVTRAFMDDPLKKALVQVQGVFSELEKSQLVRRLKKGRERAKQERGRCEGRHPFGSTPEEKKVVERIRAMRRRRRNGTRGMTLQEIADRLNSEDISTKSGGEWSAAKVYHVLHPRRREGSKTKGG